MAKKKGRQLRLDVSLLQSPRVAEEEWAYYSAESPGLWSCMKCGKAGRMTGGLWIVALMK
jgi:hypothetical protein